MSGDQGKNTESWGKTKLFNLDLKDLLKVEKKPIITPTIPVVVIPEPEPVLEGPKCNDKVYSNSESVGTLVLSAAGIIVLVIIYLIDINTNACYEPHEYNNNCIRNYDRSPSMPPMRGDIFSEKKLDLQHASELMNKDFGKDEKRARLFLQGLCLFTHSAF